MVRRNGLPEMPPSLAPRERSGGEQPISGSPETIRVVSSGRKATDISHLSQNKISSLADDIADENPSIDRKALKSLAGLAQSARVSELEKASPGALPLLANRQLMYDDSVVPVGVNLSVDSKSKLEENARPPRRKDLWPTHEPKSGRGLPYALWANAAAPEDRLAITALAFDSSKLGRGNIRTPTSARTRVGILESITAFVSFPEGRVGAWDGNLLVHAAALIDSAAGKGVDPASWSAARLRKKLYRREIDPRVLRDLKRVRNVSRSFFVGLPNGSGSVDLSSIPPARRSVVVEGSRTKELSKALNNFYEFVNSEASAHLVEAIIESKRVVENHARTKSTQYRKTALSELAEDVPDRVFTKNDLYENKIYEMAQEWVLQQVEPLLQTKYHRARSAMSAISEIHALGVVDVLYNVLRDSAGSKPRKDADIRKTFEKYGTPVLKKLEEKINLRIARNRMAKQEHDRVVKSKQYLIIIEDKLGGARYNEVMSHMMSNPIFYDIDDPMTVLDALDSTAKQKKKGGFSRDREVVITEYENMKRGWELDENSSRLQELVKKLRYSTSIIEERRALDRVLSEADPADVKNMPDDRFIKAKGPNAPPLICPHVVKYYRLRFSNTPYEQLRNQLGEYVNRVPYKGSEDVQVHGYAYYCKICGEQLFTRTDTTLGGISSDDSGIAIAGKYDDYGDGVRKFIWSTTMRVLNVGPRGKPILRFSQPLQPKRFADEAASMCLPEVLRTAKGAKLSAGLADLDGGVDTPASREMKLHTVITLYAYFFMLVIDSAAGKKKAGGKHDDSVTVHVEGVRDGASSEQYARALLIHLVKTNSHLISKMVGVTNEQIGNQFQMVYRNFLDNTGRLMVYAQDMSKIVANSLMLHNPYFNALRVGSSVARFDGGKPDQPVRSEYEPEHVGKMFRMIMGSTLSDIVTYEPPKNLGVFVRSIIAGKGAADLPKGVDPEWARNLPEISAFSQSWGSDGQGAKRRGDAARYWKNSKKWNDRAAGFYDGLYLLIQYTANVHSAETMEEFSKLLKTATERSNKRILEQDARRLPVLTDISMHSDEITKRLDELVVDESKLYGEDGHEHQWDIYIWKGKGKTIKLKRNEFMDAIEQGVLEGLKFADMQCSVCGTLKSKTSSLNNNKVTKMVESKFQINNFYQYYNTRCPESGMHKFENGKCVKCGVKLTYLTKSGRAADVKGSMSYYEKYKGTFSKVIGKTVSILQEPVPRVIRPQPPALPVRDKTKINTLVEILRKAKLDVTDKQIESIGATEGRTLQEVKAGTNMDDPPENLEDSRVYDSDFAVGELMGRYNVVMSAVRSLPGSRGSRALRENPWMRRVVKSDLFEAESESYSKKPSPIDEFNKEITDMYNLYVSNRNKFIDAANHPSTEDMSAWVQAIIYFSVDSLCALASKIAGHSALLHDFVVSTFRSILLTESRMTVAGDFEWSVLFGTSGDGGTHVILDDEDSGLSMSPGDSSNDVGEYSHGDVESDKFADAMENMDDQSAYITNDSVDVEEETLENNL